MTTAKKPKRVSAAIAEGRRVLNLEAAAVAGLAERLGKEFEAAVKLLLSCQGRAVVTGIGKAGAVARKLAGTLASTGTPALFLHPAEGVHGDLGMVVQGDVLLALSHSGESEELIAILPAIRRLGVPVLAFTGRPDSQLAQRADVVVDVSVPREACPHNLAPTASTTALLAMGDALAIAVMRARKFTAADFARLHPAGALGRRALLTARDLMRTGEMLAAVREDTLLRDVLFAITAAHAGAACVLNRTGRLVGIVTDGDIRRCLLACEQALGRPAREAMTPNPKTVAPDKLAAEAMRTMQDFQIGEMPVLEAGRPVGMLNLKDLLRAGVL
jgi:arabinose-5-phosphate isomerase